MLENLARGENLGWQKQIHFDGAYNFCKYDFGALGIGINSMGAHFNPISLSIIHSESKASINACWEATVKGFYSLFTEAQFCDAP